MKVEELALQRKRYAHLTDEEWRWLLQQVEGHERTREKLPTMAAIEDWWYPVRLSCEQCSSEPTARWKAERLEAVKSLEDASLQFRGRREALAFGNRIALTNDLVVVRATDASALPTNCKFAGAPIDSYSLEDAAKPLQDGSKAAYRLEAKGGETHTPYPLSITQERARGERLEAGKPIPHIHYPLPKKRAKGVLVDLTGGYGVDTYFMSEHFAQVHYVEQNEELCRIAQHNFALTRPHIQVHNTHAEEFLSRETNDEKCVFYIDPARRDKHGGKVFRIEDCEPNVVALLPTLLRRAERIIIKLSPMLDITAALRSLQIPMDVDIVAVNNEVKEVLLWSKIDPTPCRIHAVNLGSKTAEWSFTQEEERQAQCILWDAHGGEPLTEGTYIYEPNAAILKSGAYKLVGARYGLQKWGQNTHLYLSTHYVEDFPGRVWRMKEVVKKDTKDIRASVMTRNYPLTADQLRKKLKAKEGDTMTIIGARLGDKPIVVLAEKC